MEFGFGIQTSTGVDTELILGLEKELKVFFIKKNYGGDLKKIVMGICCMAEEFENFYKRRKPSYTAYKEITIVNKKIIIDRVFEYEIWLNFKVFNSLSEKGAKKLLAQEILKSLSNLDTLPKKIKDFIREKFKYDMERFFSEQKLI